MPFPDNPIIGAGTRVLLGEMPSQTDVTPRLYTLTATAAISAGATSISLTASPASPAIRLQHGRRLTFGSTTVEVNVPSNPDDAVDDVVVVAGTAVSVPIRPSPGTVALNATATTFELFHLLGISQANPVLQPQASDVTNMESGFGQSNAVVGVNRSIAVQGFRMLGDRALFSIIMPYLTNNDRIRRLLWCEMQIPTFGSTNEIYRGPVRITDGGQTNQVRTSLNYNFTFTFQSNNFGYVSGEAEVLQLFNPPGNLAIFLLAPLLPPTLTQLQLLENLRPPVNLQIFLT